MVGVPAGKGCSRATSDRLVLGGLLLDCLPFYYYTGGNERYKDGLLQSFNVPSGGVERLDRVQISRRADPGVFVANRAVMPQRGQLTAVRAAHFRPPEALPPPPQ